MADAIIDQEVALSKSHPHVHPLGVLDLAMQGREGPDLDFSAPDPNYSDWLDPPTPFGELLRRAFAAGKICDDAAALFTVAQGRWSAPYRVNNFPMKMQSQ